MAYAIWARYPGELWNYPPVIGYKLKVAMPKASPLLWKQAENDAYLAMLGGFVALISKHEDSF